MKFRGFEFEDQSWFPDVIRNYMTDYLRFLFHTFKLYQPVLPILREALIKTNNYQILDLCSGSGGAMEGVYDNLKQTLREDVKITLSDLFPNTLISKHLSNNTKGAISYVAWPVDATSVPCELNGFRTLFSGFHHFDPVKATAVIKNAIESQRAIAIFDGGNRNGWMILSIMVLHPILIFLCTPLIRPIHVSRLLFTYVIPVIPLCTVWDGIVSVLRLYKPKEMLEMAKQADLSYSYVWDSGMVRNKYGMSIAYLVGYPINKNL